MEGITILSETVTRDVTIFACIMLIIVGAIFLATGITCIIISIDKKVPQLLFLSAILILLSFASALRGIVHLSDKPYTVYKVTIDDEVSFNKFNEKYEIIKQDGKIYEIKEREDEKCQ